MESIEFLRKQEHLYWKSDLKEKRWYRKILGGKWRLLKLGKDTPYIGMFCVWTKMPDECWSGYREVMITENYTSTGIDTKRKLYKAILMNLFK